MQSDETPQPQSSPSLPSSDSSRAAASRPVGRIRDYDLWQKIGQGGMGAVYRASHRMLKREVAIKVLPADRMHDAESVIRFRREMEAVGKLIHPNIVQAYDAGEENGVHYLVMEYVDGRDVGVVLRKRGPLCIADACEIVRQAAVGLQHAHESQLVHRDVKPSNLLLAADGQVKVLDLGLALLGESDSSQIGNLTSTGQIMGTIDYLAPEQAHDTHAVDIRADIYSLGCTLYALLAGSPPFSGPQYSTAMKKLSAHVGAAPPPLDAVRADVPSPLAETLARMLAKSPAERFASPAEVAAALTPWTEGADLARLAEPAPLVEEGEPFAADSSHDTNRSPSPTLTATQTYLTPAGIAVREDASHQDRPSGRRTPLVWAVLVAAVTIAGVGCVLMYIKIKTRKGGTAAQAPRGDPNAPATASGAAADPSAATGKRTPAGGTARSLGPVIRPRHDWRNILFLADPAKDAVAGDWRFEGTGLLAQKTPQNGRLMLPVLPEGAYHLRIRFKRLDGEETVGVLLPVADTQVALFLSVASGKHGGLQFVNGQPVTSDNNPAVIRPSKLENGREYTLVVGVQTQGDSADIAVEIDGHRVVRWEGKVSRLSNDQVWSLPEAGRPALCYRNCAVQFRSAEIRVLDGQAQLLRPLRSVRER